jgi:small basic protein
MINFLLLISNIIVFCCLCHVVHWLGITYGINRHLSAIIVLGCQCLIGYYLNKKAQKIRGQK